MPVCPSCSSQNITILGVIPSAVSFAGRLLDEPIPGGKLFRCNCCRLGFRHPHLDKRQLDALYRQGKNDAWSVSDAKTRNDWNIACGWIDTNVKAGSVLDIGCFDGTFLASLGADYKKFGIEIHPGAARRAQEHGVNIVGADLAHCADGGRLYDVVVAFDVIEHVEDPRQFLQQLAGYVKPGGYLIISSGDLDARSWRLMGSRYWYCVIPEHISFVSPKWSLGAAKNLKLRVVDIEHFSHAMASPLERIMQFMKNMLYRFSPGISAWLRSKGVGHRVVLEHRELLEMPPVWITAKDHFLVIFSNCGSKGA